MRPDSITCVLSRAGHSTVTPSQRRVMSACASPVRTIAPRIPFAGKASRRARDQLLDLRFSAHGRDAIAYACHSAVRRARRARLAGRRPCFEVVHLVRPVHRRPLAGVLSRAYTPPGGGPRPRAHRPRSRPFIFLVGRSLVAWPVFSHDACPCAIPAHQNRSFKRQVRH